MFLKDWTASTLLWLIVCACNLCFVPLLSAQIWDDSIVGKRVRIRIAQDRQWLGRESINDLERCWDFINAATGGKLPSRVLVVIHWQDAIATIDAGRATVSLGMNDPSAVADAKGFLLHSAARELARMALISLSGGVAKEDTRFLLDGMSEMLAHDFSNTVKRIGASWAIAYYLDRIHPLGLKQMSSRSELSGNAHDLRSAAPGITFLTTCRELFGRERTLKLFESLARKSLEESLLAVFRTPADKVESQWLARVRGYTPAEITITTAEEAPTLDRISFVPDPGKPGAQIGMRIFTRDKTNDLTAAGIYAIDESSGRVLQGRQMTASGDRHTQIEIPVESGRQDGRYKLLVVAVDEGGNLRNWEASYVISR